MREVLSLLRFRVYRIEILWCEYQTSSLSLCHFHSWNHHNLKIVDVTHKWQITEPIFIHLNPFSGIDIKLLLFNVIASSAGSGDRSLSPSLIKTSWLWIFYACASAIFLRYHSATACELYWLIHTRLLPTSTIDTLPCQKIFLASFFPIKHLAFETCLPSSVVDDNFYAPNVHQSDIRGIFQSNFFFVSMREVNELISPNTKQSEKKLHSKLWFRRQSRKKTKWMGI